MSLINNLKTPVDIYSVADVAFRLLSCLSWLLLVGQNHSVSQSLTGPLLPTHFPLPPTLLWVNRCAYKLLYSHTLTHDLSLPVFP